MSVATLLVELFTEELPPKALEKLGGAFASVLQNSLSEKGLFTDGSKMGKIFATPRRLAVTILGIPEKSKSDFQLEKLLPVSVGIDAEGNATQALLKKLNSRGLGKLTLADLKRESDGKQVCLYAQGWTRSIGLAEALQAALNDAIKSLPVPKVMTYQLADGQTSVQFVRPAHGLVALRGANIVPVNVLGLDAGRISHGHRFQGMTDIELAHADEYEERLEKDGAVIASFDKRRHEIERLLFERAEEHGSTLGEREDYLALLDEVTALFDRRPVYPGAFEADFLSVQQECLILTMNLNQKYFPLFFSDGSLSSRFLIVSNMRLNNPHNVIEGNQRVVRPRLSDARFFFETDKKTRLEARVPRLANVVYHNKLGNQLERTERVKKLAGDIAVLIGADKAQAERAAYLAKADLLTDMVGEFPELQGTMGRYYALHDGESPIVADAIAQHYQPRFAGDKLPESTVALSVALADKMETLMGLFGIGQQPTGDKDPFALRRHALGVLRMLMEKQLVVPLHKLVDTAFSAFPPGMIQHAHTDLGLFMNERLRGILREQGYSANEVEAVITRLGEGAHIAPQLLAAVRAFGEMPEAASLAAANKRIGNILAKSGQRFSGAEASVMVEPAERLLFDALNAAGPVFDKLYAIKDFTGALKSLAPLKVPVDAFFEHVMVNTEDSKLRENRLALLHDLHEVMNKIADLSKLAA